MKITVTCNTCGKKFDKERKEINRQMKKGKTNNFCSLSCAAIFNNKRCEDLTKICPICGAIFQTKTGKTEKTYCSRSCASKGSVNNNRREAGKKAAALNFTPDTHNIQSIQKIMKTREAWKYVDIKKFLNFINEPYEFEHILENQYIYDLVLFQKKIIIEFDGPDHKYLDETTKENLAEKHGYKITRIITKPNTIIKPSELYHLFQT